MSIISNLPYLPTVDGDNLTISTKTGTIPEGYYEDKTWTVNSGSGTDNASLTTNVSGALGGSSSDGTPKVQAVPTHTVSTPGWITTSDITDGSGDTKYIKKGSGTSDWTISNNDYVFDDSTYNSPYTFYITPTVTISTSGWIKTGDVTPSTSTIPIQGSGRSVRVKYGDVKNNATLSTDTSNALSGTSSDGTPKVTAAPTHTIYVTGWITETEWTQGSGETKYIKKGVVTPTLTMSGTPSSSSASSDYKVTGTASHNVTSGWISSVGNTTSTFTISNAGVNGSNFGIITTSVTAGAPQNGTRLDIDLSYAGQSGVIPYKGYLNGGAAYILYNTLKDVDNTCYIKGGSVQTPTYTGKSLTGVSGKILNDTTAFGVTGTFAGEMQGDYQVNSGQIFEEDDKLYYGLLHTSSDYYRQGCYFYATNSQLQSVVSNLSAGNIKSGVTILGVTGNYSGGTPTLITKTITANGTYTASSDNADGYSTVTVAIPVYDKSFQ